MRACSSPRRQHTNLWSRYSYQSRITSANRESHLYQLWSSFITIRNNTTWIPAKSIKPNGTELYLNSIHRMSSLLSSVFERAIDFAELQCMAIWFSLAESLIKMFTCVRDLQHAKYQFVVTLFSLLESRQSLFVYFFCCKEVKYWESPSAMLSHCHEHLEHNLFVQETEHRGDYLCCWNPDRLIIRAVLHAAFHLVTLELAHEVSRIAPATERGNCFDLGFRSCENNSHNTRETQRKSKSWSGRSRARRVFNQYLRSSVLRMPDLRFRTVLEMKRDFGQWDGAIFYFYSVVFTLLESII